MASKNTVASKNIVVADDTAFVRDRFAGALIEAGLSCVTAASMTQLLACLKPDHAKVDLILLDVRLSRRDGSDLARLVQQRAGADTSIVVFSGSVASAAEARSLAALRVAGFINEYCPLQRIVPSLAPHLYPDQFDRRGSPRVTVAVSTAYRTGSEIASGLTLDLGRGGLGVRTMSPLQSGAPARVKFRLPGDLRDIEAEMRVAWTDRTVGMGLQFERLNATDQAAIDDFVDRHMVTGGQR